MIAWIEADGRREKEFLEEIRRRGGQARQDALPTVQDILEQVRRRGDAAVRALTLRYDRAAPENFRVSPEEWEEGIRRVPPELAAALSQAAKNIRIFHERQKQISWHMTGPEGVFLGQEIRALRRVGIYVPGGTAVYPSSVLMNAIPAQVAGVEEIHMVTPPSPEGGVAPAVLAAAKLAGVHAIYKVGGAQAVAALAYGTESIPRVDKITGPGNLYVALAKSLVFGQVDIDQIAGPSEILILAENMAENTAETRKRADFIAADLLSQAEHDPLASAILITDSALLAECVLKALEAQLEVLPRKEIARRSLRDFGGVMVARSMEEAVELANAFAPEHLEIMAREPMAWLGRLRNAGAIFMGDFSPEPLGDYFAGPNHILPTGGTARFASPLSTDDFMKKTSLVYYSEKALKSIGEQIIVMAQSEGLQAHAQAIRVRMEAASGEEEI
jgi:histidinol dehydrogenase